MSESYDSAAFLLRHSSLAHLLSTDVLNDATERIDFDVLDKCTLSSGEQVILEAASALFGGFSCAPIGEAIRTLDDENYAALVRAMEMRRPSAFTTNLVAVKRPCPVVHEGRAWNPSHCS